MAAAKDIVLDTDDDKTPLVHLWIDGHLLEIRVESDQIVVASPTHHPLAIQPLAMEAVIIRLGRG